MSHADQQFNELFDENLKVQASMIAELEVLRKENEKLIQEMASNKVQNKQLIQQNAELSKTVATLKHSVKTVTNLKDKIQNKLDSLEVGRVGNIESWENI